MSEGEKISYSRSQEVPTSGIYVCVPCGYKHPYTKGDHFGECVSCLAGSKDGDQEFVEGIEMWELLEEKPFCK